MCGTVFIAFVDFAQLYFTTKCGSKKEYKKQNLTKQNENKYNSSQSLRFDLCRFTAHYTVD